MRFLIMLLLALPLSSATAPARADESSASEIALKMIEAHGGMQAWKNAPSMRFKQTMVAPQQPDDPWVSIEVTEQGRRRCYQDWPLDNAIIAYDGDKVWSVDWARGNPPKFMVNLGYYFLNLPWLTQDDGVILTDPDEGKLPNDSKTYITIRMTFEAGVGDSPDDYYVIFVDPDTYLMRGAEFIVTYGPMLDLFGLPEEATFVGPLVKVYETYATVDGLKIPRTYKTYTPDGTMYGDHTVENISFTKTFDESRMKMPDGAVIDTSSNKRKKSGS